MSEKQCSPGSSYQPLFDYLNDQFGVLALESDMAEIIEIIHKMEALHPSESAGIPYQKCPKCNGQGKVLIPPHVPGDAATWSSSTVTDYVCDVCNGMKVIAMGMVGAVWVKASTWPTDYNMVHWRRVDDKRPLLVIGRNYQENIIAQFGKVYEPHELEWLDESTAAPAQSGKDTLRETIEDVLLKTSKHNQEP